MKLAGCLTPLTESDGRRARSKRCGCFVQLVNFVNSWARVRNASTLFQEPPLDVVDSPPVSSLAALDGILSLGVHQEFRD